MLLLVIVLLAALYLVIQDRNSKAIKIALLEEAKRHSNKNKKHNVKKPGA